VSAVHATPVETSTTPETTTSSPARQRVIGNKAGGDESDCRECSESKPKHDAFSLLI
jgi:hypothetical protein